MTIMTSLPALVLRSPDASLDRARWEQLPDDGNRYEVIEGVLYMTTAPSFFHQWIASRIIRMLQTQLEDTGVGLVAFAPIGLFMQGCDPVQPDIVMIRTSDLEIIHDRRIFGIPTLLVEILSPTNPETDLQIKRGAYARAGVPEYWIVRPATRDVLVCSRPDALLGDYAQTQLIDAGGALVSPTLPFQSTVADFFAGAPDTTL